jgi:hypothetical protein
MPGLNRLIDYTTAGWLNQSHVSLDRMRLGKIHFWPEAE